MSPIDVRCRKPRIPLSCPLGRNGSGGGGQVLGGVKVSGNTMSQRREDCRGTLTPSASDSPWIGGTEVRPPRQRRVRQLHPSRKWPSPSCHVRPGPATRCCLSRATLPRPHETSPRKIIHFLVRFKPTHHSIFPLTTSGTSALAFVYRVLIEHDKQMHKLEAGLDFTKQRRLYRYYGRHCRMGRKAHTYPTLDSCPWRCSGGAPMLIELLAITGSLQILSHHGTIL